MQARHVAPIVVVLATMLLAGPTAWAGRKYFYDNGFAGYEKEIVRYYECLSDAHEQARKGDWRDFRKKLYEAERLFAELPWYVRNELPETRTLKDRRDHERFELYFKYLARYFGYLRSARKQAEDGDWDDYYDEMEKAEEAWATAQDYLHGRYVVRHRPADWGVGLDIGRDFRFHIGTGAGFRLGLGLGRRAPHREHRRRHPDRRDHHRMDGHRRDEHDRRHDRDDHDGPEGLRRHHRSDDQAREAHRDDRRRNSRDNEHPRHNLGDSNRREVLRRRVPSEAIPSASRRSQDNEHPRHNLGELNRREVLRRRERSKNN